MERQLAQILLGVQQQAAQFAQQNEQLRNTVAQQGEFMVQMRQQSQAELQVLRSSVEAQNKVLETALERSRRPEGVVHVGKVGLKLVNTQHSRHKTEKSCNSEGKKKRKIILESVNNARQIVTWDAATNCYKVSWISKKELVEQHRQKRADKMWKNQCFNGTCRTIPEFARPVTEGQALVSWMEMGCTWRDARAYWRQFPLANIEPMKADKESRKRIRRTLKRIVIP